MNNALILAIGLMLVGIGIQIYGKVAIDNDKQRFAFACYEKGGITLSGYDKFGNTWIGCYKGIEEIPNEDSIK